MTGSFAGSILGGSQLSITSSACTYNSRALHPLLTSSGTHIQVAYTHTKNNNANLKIIFLNHALMNEILILVASEFLASH